MRNLVLGLVALLAAGCANIGGSPEGASSADMKSTFEKLPVDDRAKMLLESPGPMDDAKKARVKEMYAKDGKAIPADIEKMMGGSGTGR